MILMVSLASLLIKSKIRREITKQRSIHNEDMSSHLIKAIYFDGKKDKTKVSNKLNGNITSLKKLKILMF